MNATLARLALRSHTTGVAVTTLIALLFGAGNVFGFAEIAGDTPAERRAFAAQMELVGRQLAYLLPLPRELDTLAGYLHWRHYGNLPLVYAFWAVIAGVGASRGDEERGLVPLWLSAGVPRARYFAVRVAGFAVLAALSIAVMTAAVALGARATAEPLDAAAAALQGVALLALAATCFGLGLAAAQVVATRRAATGLAAAVVLALFLANALARVDPAAPAWLSPFGLYERSDPLLAAGALDGGAVALLAGAAAALTAAAGVAFSRRDVGEALLRRRGGGRVERAPARDPLLRLPVLALLDRQAPAILGWAAGVSVLTAFLVSLARTIVDQMRTASPALAAYFERAGVQTYDTFVGAIWGTTMLLLVALYAIAQVAGWSADESEGRLDAVLAQPVTRARVVLERIAAAALGAAAVAASAAAAGYATAAMAGIALDAGEVALAAALLVLVAVAFLGVGAAISGRFPRAAVVGLGLVAIHAYFVQQFAPLFGWPDLVRDLSLFGLYGEPIGGDARPAGAAALLAVGAVGSLLAVAAFRRRDVGR